MTTFKKETAYELLMQCQDIEKLPHFLDHGFRAYTRYPKNETRRTQQDALHEYIKELKLKYGINE